MTALQITGLPENVPVTIEKEQRGEAEMYSVTIGRAMARRSRCLRCACYSDGGRERGGRPLVSGGVPIQSRRPTDLEQRDRQRIHV